MSEGVSFSLTAGGEAGDADVLGCLSTVALVPPLFLLHLLVHGQKLTYFLSIDVTVGTTTWLAWGGLRRAGDWCVHAG